MERLLLPSRLLRECLWGDTRTVFLDSSDPAMIDAGHQHEWADIEMTDGSVKKCEDPRGPTGHKWTGYTVFVLLDRPVAGENAEQETEDRSALNPKTLKVPVNLLRVTTSAQADSSALQGLV